MANNDKDLNEIGGEGEHEDEPIMGFASALGSSFDVEVDTEKLKDKAVEKLKSDHDYYVDMPDWKDDDLETYQSPNLKELQDTGKGVCDGKISDADFKKTIDKISLELDKTISDFNEIKKGEPDSITAKEQVVRIERAFALHIDAFKEMNLYFVDKNKDHILKGLEMAQKATNRLYRSFTLLQESTEIVSTKLCIQCGYRNPATVNVCEQCNAQLPKKAQETSQIDLSEAQQQAVYYTNPNFDRLYKEITELKEDKLPTEQFEKTIDWLCSNLEAGRKEYEKLDTSFFNEEEKKMFGEVFAYAEKSFAEYTRAYNEIRTYFNDNDTKHLDEGLKIAFEATQIIAQVEKFTADVEKALKELEVKNKEGKKPEEEEEDNEEE